MTSGRELLAFMREVASHNNTIPREDSDFDPDETPTAPVKAPKPERYVLLVEDDPDIRDTVKQCLCDLGYTVKTAVHGEEALAILDREYMRTQAAGAPPAMPSVILLDIMMPVMSGLEFYAVLRRARPQFAAVPVIVMSADTSITYFQDWAINIADLDVPRDKLPKPFALNDLTEKVAKAAGLPPDKPA